MNRIKSRITLPIIITVISANILGVLALLEHGAKPYSFIVSYPSMFFALASLMSLLLIKICNIDYVRAYKRSLITSALLLLSFIPAGWVWLMVVYYSNNNPEDSFPIVAIIYPIICILLIANRVRLTLKRHTEANKPKLSQILAITFINPLLPAWPLLMALASIFIYW